MSKIVLAIAIVFMMVATATLVSAEKGAAGTESGATNSVGSATAKPESAASENTVGGKAIAKNAEGREYLIRAWGRYGPVSLSEGWSAFYRIYYPGSFLGQPSVVDSLAVRYPQDIFTSYSLGRDRGYSVLSRFDARLAVHDGSLVGAYIDWVAIRG